MADSELDSLFTTPSDTATSKSPSFNTPSPESTQTLLRLLKENHLKWHIFTRERGFHNHLVHHLLAIYALGASEELIQAAYDNDIIELKEIVQVLEAPTDGDEREKAPLALPVIDESNWKDYLGDDRYYGAYLKFFTHQLLILKKDSESSNGRNAIEEMLEEYVFSPQANYLSTECSSSAFDGRNGNEGPGMLDRLTSSLVHSLIHVGYGLEFGLDGVLVEGLAQTAIHKKQSGNILPPYLFTRTPRAPSTSNSNSSSLLSILSHIISTGAGTGSDALRLTRVPPAGVYSIYGEVMKMFSEDIVQLMNGWIDMTASSSEEEDLPSEEEFDEWIRSKVREVQFVCVVLYGVCGWSWMKTRKKRDSRADRVEKEKSRFFQDDFFTMHFITSSHFLPYILSSLKSRYSKKLLLWHFMCCVFSWWIARGRPEVDLRGFMEMRIIDSEGSVEYNNEADDSETIKIRYLREPNPEWALKSSASDESPQEDLEKHLWSSIIKKSLIFPDEHVPKLIRTLYHYASYQFNDKHELEEIEKELIRLGFIDSVRDSNSGLGDIFLKTAILSMETLLGPGGKREDGGWPWFWSYEGFYDG